MGISKELRAILHALSEEELLRIMAYHQHHIDLVREELAIRLVKERAGVLEGHRG